MDATTNTVLSEPVAAPQPGTTLPHEQRNTRLADLWLDALAAEHGAAASTLATYRDDLRCYLTFLRARRRALPEVTLEDVRAYIADLSHRSYAETTLAHRRSVVRTLHRFLVAEGFSLQDPTRDVAPMKRSSPLPYTPTVQNVDRLLESAHAQAADLSFGLYRQAGHARRAALLEVLYASGMRISEALSLPATAVQPHTRALTIIGKGGNHHRESRYGPVYRP
jgi:integrase/recombinase XerD